MNPETTLAGILPSYFSTGKVLKAWEDNNNEEDSVLDWYSIIIPVSEQEG